MSEAKDRRIMVQAMAERVRAEQRRDYRAANEWAAIVERLQEKLK